MVRFKPIKLTKNDKIISSLSSLLPACTPSGDAELSTKQTILVLCYLRKLVSDTD